MSNLDLNEPQSNFTCCESAHSCSLESQSALTSYFDDIILTGVLKKAKFAVLLGCLPQNQESFAVKLFPFQGSKINPCFRHEIRFRHLRHENITSIHHFEESRDAIFDDGSKKVSYTIMELAAHGDLCNLLLSPKVRINDKLTRTFFHQLISGIEYLHSVGVSHLDLKFGNLLLADDYTLKICDFDQAYMKGQKNIYSRGTENFRSPEIAQGRCLLPEAADLYSIGIILFTLKCKGQFPFLEEEEGQEMNLYNLMICEPGLFWKRHCEILDQEELFFDDDFKALFLSLVAFRPQKRATIDQIKSSRWYSGPVYTPSEVKDLLKDQF